MSDKKEFWSKFPSVDCPKCGKSYQQYNAFLVHLKRFQGMTHYEAGDIVLRLFKEAGVNLSYGGPRRKSVSPKDGGKDAQ